MSYSSGAVRLRALEEEDVDPIVGHLAGEASWGMRGIRHDRHGPMSRAEIRAQVEGWPKRELGQVLAIEADGALVGFVEAEWDWDALSPSLWVFVVPEVRRRGYGRIAARLVLDRLFTETPAVTVQAWVDEPLEESLHFAAAMGFSAAGRVRRAGIRDGRYFDAIPLQLLRATWEAPRAG